MWYPVGQYFSSDNFDYIRKAASSINKVFPTGKLILVVRGHSGSILAGGIVYILKRKDRDVLISVSRKSESTHGDNLEGGKRGTNRYWEANKRIASHFEYILCNRPDEK